MLPNFVTRLHVYEAAPCASKRILLFRTSHGNPMVSTEAVLMNEFRGSAWVHLRHHRNNIEPIERTNNGGVVQVH